MASKILVVTRNLPPLVGGMERLNWHLLDELSKIADVRVVAPAGSARRLPQGVGVAEVPLNPLWKFVAQSLWQTLREARRWKPTLVLAGSGLTAPAALLAAKANGARSAAYVHGLDLTISHVVYRSVWLWAVRKLDHVIANSMPTRNLALGIGVDPGKVSIVHPGVDATMKSAKSPPAEGFRSAHQLSGRLLMISVGRMSERKGLLEFVTHALPAIVDAVPGAVLLVVGDVPSNALHAKAQTRQSIQQAANDQGIGESVRFFGTVPDELLADMLGAADVHVFPIRELPGDPEGFGMVAIEAAAHGLPTVAFAAGGAVDSVCEGVSGKLVAPGDYAGFASTVIDVAANRERLRASSIAFASRFDWPEFGAKIARKLSIHG